MTRLNGCHNRAPLRTSAVVQDGWFMDGVTRTPRMISVPHRMTTECQYSRDPMGLGQQDPGCHGCRWRAAQNPTTNERTV